MPSTATVIKYPGTDSFLFRGHDMKKEFGIWMTKTDPLIPPQRKQMLQVPFHDGSYEFDGDYYDNRTISVDCDTRNGMTRDKLRYLAQLFTLKSRIVFWDEPDKYYMGKIYEDRGFRDMCRFIREFTLTFICDPFAYGATVETLLPYRATGANAYVGTARTPTRIEVLNTGTGSILTTQIRVRSREVLPYTNI